MTTSELRSSLTEPEEPRLPFPCEPAELDCNGLVLVCLAGRILERDLTMNGALTTTSLSGS